MPNSQMGRDLPWGPWISYLNSLPQVPWLYKLGNTTNSSSQGQVVSNDCCPGMFLLCLKKKKLIVTSTLQWPRCWKTNGKCHAWITCRKYQNKMNPSATFIQIEQRPHCFYLVIGWIYMDSVTGKLECWKMFYTFRDHEPLLWNKELTIHIV